jgi:hypothetical protein
LPAVIIPALSFLFEYPQNFQPRRITLALVKQAGFATSILLESDF